MKRIAIVMFAATAVLLSGCVVVPAGPHAFAYDGYPGHTPPGYVGFYYGPPHVSVRPAHRHYGGGWWWRGHWEGWPHGRHGR